MVDKILVVLQQVTPVIEKSAVQIVKKISEHFVQHGGKYIAGAGGAVVAGGLAYSKGRDKGKKEWMGKQAGIDARKIQQLKDNQDKEREDWKRQKKGYDDLLDDIEKNI